jgi:GDP-mannose 4,6-dehydratase
MKRALICGISGQDGSYLARLLLEKGYEVHGTARDAQMANFGNHNKLGIVNRITLHSMALNDFRSVLHVLTRVQPDEIYNLAGQSSVGLSFDQPVETLESISVGTLNLLEAIRFMQQPIKLIAQDPVNASAILATTRQTKIHLSTPAVPTPLQRPPRFGRSPTTARRIISSLVSAFSLTMSHRYDRNDSSPKRLSRQPVVSPLAVVRNCTWVTSPSPAIGVGLQNMSKQCG